MKKLNVEHGVVQYNQHRSDFSTQLEGVAIAARYLPLENRYEGMLSHEKGLVRLGQSAWNYGLRLTLSVGQAQIGVERLIVSTADSRLEAKGVIRNLSYPSGEIDYEGNIGLTDARPLYPDLRNLQGIAKVAGKLTFSQDEWKTTGTVDGSRLSVNKARVERLTSGFEFSPARLRFTGIHMTGLHGKAEGQFGVVVPLCCTALQGRFSIQQDRIAGSFVACRA